MYFGTSCRRRGRVAVLIAALLLILSAASCQRAPTPAPSLPSAAVQSAPAPISLSAIEEFVQKWQAAQNAGELETYKSLYGEHFFGVRRSGTRVVTFDRTAWMKDRARMFGKPQHITVTKLAVPLASPQRATVRFTQEFSSGNFRDTGVKELALIGTPAGLRIAHEELLASSVLPTEAEGRFLHLLGGDVVLVNNAPESWGRGEPYDSLRPPALLADGIEITYRRLRAENVPAHLSGWQGRSLVLFALAGPVCKATVAELALASALYLDSLRSLGFADEDGVPPPSRQVVTQSKWDEGRKLLVAKLARQSGDCKGAVFARAAELPVPKLSRFEEAKPPWLGIGFRLFRTQPLYAQIQASWERFLKQQGIDPDASDGGAANAQRPLWLHKRWDGSDEPQYQYTRQINIAQHPLRDTYILSVRSFQSMDPETIIGTMWATWEVSGTPSAPVVVPLNQPAQSWSLPPLAALDIDGDGHLEFLNKGGLLSAAAEHPLAYTHQDSLELPKRYACYDGDADPSETMGGTGTP